MTRTEIESRLDRLAHLHRCIWIEGDRLAVVRAAAVTDEVKRLRRLADELEADALDLPKIQEINQDIDRLQGQAQTLEAEIKAEVLSLGASVKGMDLQAVYSKGRVSWDDRGLSGYALGVPAILQFRTEGKPSVSLREIKG